MTTERRKFGDHGEDAAAAFLARKGLRIIARNVRLGRLGELDLIALDGREIVFVEVKARRGSAFGLPEEAVTPSKLRTVAACADAWRIAKGWTARPYRIDVVAIDGTGEPRHLAGVRLD